MVQLWNSLAYQGKKKAGIPACPLPTRLEKWCPASTPLLLWSRQVVVTGNGWRQGWDRPTTAQPWDRQKLTDFLLFGCFILVVAIVDWNIPVNFENILCFHLLSKLTCFISLTLEQQNRAVHSTLISYQFYFYFSRPIKNLQHFIA